MSKDTNTALKINKIQPTDEKITGRGENLLIRKILDIIGNRLVIKPV
jgi:hypothetical protein